MIWTNEDKLTVYVGQRVVPQSFINLFSPTQIVPPLVDVVGLTCGTIDTSKLYFIQGKDMNVRELMGAKYHINSKHITVESTFLFYTTDKKTLFDYYKKQFHEGIRYIDSLIEIQEREVNKPLNNEIYTIAPLNDGACKIFDEKQYALKNLQKYRDLKASAMNAYRQTIEDIKKL